jgi:hypothetical protein
MRHLSVIATGLLVIGTTVFGCAQMSGGDAGWTTLIDGTAGLDAGTTRRRQLASGGRRHRRTRKLLPGLQIRAEFWADHNANSGIYMRCADPNVITDKSCYEANIFDQRPDPTFGTGGIVHVAPVTSMHKAGGKWNVYEITARGSQLIVVLNGVQTAKVEHSQFVQGPIALSTQPPPKGDRAAPPVAQGR